MRTLVPTILLGFTAALMAQGPGLQGRIVDVLGEPVPAASVEAVVDGRVVARTTSDGEGIYLLAKAPASRAEVHVRAADRVAVSLPWRGITSPRICNVVMEDASQLRGRVTDATGAAVAGAAVVVVAGLFTAETISDGQGVYDFPAVPMRRGIVRASLGASLTEQALHLGDAGRCDLRLVSQRRGVRLVRVKGLPAAAADQAYVEITAGDMALMQGAGRLPLRADGTVEMVATQTCLVQVTVPGFVATPLGVLACRGGESPIDFELSPAPARGTKMVGQVTSDESGAFGGIRLAVRDRSNCDVGTTTVDAYGHFELLVDLAPQDFCRVGLESRDWQLVGGRAAAADGFRWLSATVDSDVVIELQVESAARLSSQLVLADGRRMVFAEVVIADPERPYAPLVRRHSDRAGYVDLQVPPGDYEVLAVGHDGHLARAKLQMERGRGATRCEWQEVPTGTIEGVLRDAAGRPVPGAEILLTEKSLQEVGEVPWLRLACTVITDRRGRYCCRGLPPGTWTAVVRNGRDGIRASGDLTHGATTTIDLGSGR